MARVAEKLLLDPIERSQLMAPFLKAAKDKVQPDDRLRYLRLSMINSH